MVAPRAIRDKAVMIKQGVSLFTSQQHQAVVAEYLTSGDIERHIPEIVTLYRPRRDAMAQAVEGYFPPEFETNCPEGGMFLWSQLRSGLSVPSGFSLQTVFDEAVEQGVGFVSGKPFYAYPENAPVSMRLNFTNQTEANIERGIQIIGSLLGAQLQK
jgi:2-aminoadipate transaminase